MTELDCEHGQISARTLRVRASAVTVSSAILRTVSSRDSDTDEAPPSGQERLALMWQPVVDFWTTCGRRAEAQMMNSDFRDSSSKFEIGHRGRCQ